MQCLLFPVHRPFVRPCFVCVVFVACCLVGIDWPKNDRFVRFADVTTGNSLIDGTNGFVHALVICCNPVTSFAISDFLFCTVFGTEFLAVGCLIFTSYGALLVVACGADGVLEKGRFSTSCTVNVAHAFVNGMGAGFLLPCLIVSLCVAGVHEVFTLFMASSFFGQSRLVVACHCPQLTHFSVRVL